jgi:hypothetical protein
MTMWGPKRHSYRDPAHRFNKLCKKGNTFNKNVPKRQTFNTTTNPYKDPAHRFHKHLSNFHHKKSKRNSPKFDFPSTETHHNNQHLSFFQKAKKKEIK